MDVWSCLKYDMLKGNKYIHLTAIIGRLVVLIFMKKGVDSIFNVNFLRLLSVLNVYGLCNFLGEFM